MKEERFLHRWKVPGHVASLLLGSASVIKMKTNQFLLGAAILGAIMTSASAADARAYVGGNFALELDGVNNGFVRSIDGGDVAADVVSFTEGTDNYERKHIANVKYEDFTMQIGPTMGKGVYDWISDTFDKKHSRKNGAIVAADFNYRAIRRADFMDALISEITVPACDGSSKEAAYLTVKFSPETVKWSSADGKTLSNSKPGKQKQWLSSNFRLEIPGLDCTKVSKVDAFTIKQKLAEESAGVTRDAIKIPGKIEYPNLHITLSESSAKTWLDWADSFIIKGNSTDDQEKEGKLTFYTPDFSEELVRVTFHHLGIFKVHRPLSDAKEGVAKVTVDLYVENMEIDFMAQFQQ